MKITAYCTHFVPCGPNTERGVSVPVEVEANRVLHTGSHHGYRFGLTAESQKLMEGMKARGEIKWIDDRPICWKKDHPGLRIPVLRGGQQARLVDGKCGPIEKAVYENSVPAHRAAAQKGGA